ncbi:hypothetical protein [Wolbachia endosymbiont of Rhagoletis cerasi]|uniref:hypothetical protein n=1 Tax=Wolbachia endosymbiont of Rhagoletis cerasi TaxID=225363 RepID=UPI001BD5E451|nr:hypothetical protein [Wolbachia endosymbiont of Rhagoletis cerasi]MBS9531059.1 hypothetical protein [Wolbachia endosymbiont of Rhagoletis cerasi]
MLEKIKNFFQSIAGRIASVWNSIKNLWSSNKANLVSDPKERIVALSFVKLSDGKIGLVIPQGVTLPNNKDKHGNVINDEFRLDSHYNRKVYITGRYDSKMVIENGKICLSINSVGTLDGKEVYGDNKPEEMKRLLDVSNKSCIEIQLNSPKVIANNSHTPNSETTNVEVEQHAADTSQSLNAQSL